MADNGCPHTFLPLCRRSHTARQRGSGQSSTREQGLWGHSDTVQVKGLDITTSLDKSQKHTNAKEQVLYSLRYGEY
jgi:hypothetical protein